MSNKFLTNPNARPAVVPPELKPGEEFNMYDIYDLEFDIVGYFKKDGKYREDIPIDIHFRHQDHHMVRYTNIHEDYNGVLPIGEEFVKFDDKKVYDNGFYLHNDYAITDLPPVYMLNMFPKRVFKEHDINVTYTANDGYYHRVIYNPKWKNLTEDDLTEMKKKSSNYIINNLMWVDYIDFRFNLVVNGTIYLNDVHFKILCPNLIMFLVNPFELPEDDNIEVIVEYQGIVEDTLLNYKNNSNLYKMYNDTEAIDAIFESIDTANFQLEEYSSREVTRSIYPKKYNEKVFRQHMMNTKYFSTEAILQGNSTVYGKKWIQELASEFPDFVDYENVNVRDRSIIWRVINEANLTWEEIENGGLDALLAEDGDKAFTVKLNTWDDVYNNPDLLQFNDTEEGQKNKDEFDKARTKLTDELSAIKVEEFKRNKIKRFNNVWDSNKYEVDEEGNLGEWIRKGSKHVDIPRNIVLPERNPLNKIMTEHAMAVRWYINNMIENTPYWKLHTFEHDNEELRFKGEIINELNLFGRNNILPYWCPKDTRINPRIPINYVTKPHKTVYHEDDLDYMRYEIPVKPMEHVFIEKDKQDTDPDIEDDGYYIKIYPNLIHSSDLVTLKFNTSNIYGMTLRDLLKDHNIDNVEGYVYYLGDKSYYVDVDDQLEDIMYMPFISRYKNIDTEILVPHYGNYRLHINFGVVKNGDKENKTLLFEFPKRPIWDKEIIKEYPHLWKDTLTYDEIRTGLLDEYNIDFSNLIRNINNDTDLTFYRYDKQKNSYDLVGTIPYKGSMDVYTEHNNLFLDADDVYWDYYTYQPTITNVDPKYIRVFGMDATYSSILTKSPSFILPANYMADVNRKYNMEEIVSNYVNITGNKNRTFLEYILQDYYMKGDNKIPSNPVISENIRNNLLEYTEYLKKYNRYDATVIYYDEVSKLDVNTIYNNPKGGIVVNDELDIYITKDKHLKLIRNNDEELYDVDLPRYMNTMDVTNLSIGYDTTDTQYYVYWDVDGNINADIDLGELHVFNDKQDISNYNGATFNHFVNDNHNIVLYIPEDDVYTTLTNFSYEKSTQYNILKDYNNNSRLYVEVNDGNKIKRYRLLGVDAYINYLYRNMINSKINNDINIAVQNNNNGIFDLNKLYNQFDMNNRSLVSADLILKWYSIYGYFKYIPKMTSYDKFIKPDTTIDLQMVHNGVNVIISVTDSYGNSADVINRDNDKNVFLLEGDSNFIETITQPLNHDFVGNFIKSVSLDKFKTKPVKVELIDHHNNNLSGNKVFDTIFDALYYVNKNKLSPSQPIIRLEYTYNGYISDIVEVYDKDKYDKYSFAMNNYVRIGVGLGGHIIHKDLESRISLAEHDKHKKVNYHLNEYNHWNDLITELEAAGNKLKLREIDKHKLGIAVAGYITIDEKLELMGRLDKMLESKDKPKPNKPKPKPDKPATPPTNTGGTSNTSSGTNDTSNGGNPNDTSNTPDTSTTDTSTNTDTNTPNTPDNTNTPADNTPQPQPYTSRYEDMVRIIDARVEDGFMSYINKVQLRNEINSASLSDDDRRRSLEYLNSINLKPNDKDDRIVDYIDYLVNKATYYHSISYDKRTDILNKLEVFKNHEKDFIKEKARWAIDKVENHPSDQDFGFFESSGPYSFESMLNYCIDNNLPVLEGMMQFIDATINSPNSDEANKYTTKKEQLRVIRERWMNSSSSEKEQKINECKDYIRSVYRADLNVNTMKNVEKIAILYHNAKNTIDLELLNSNLLDLFNPDTRSDYQAFSNKFYSYMKDMKRTLLNELNARTLNFNDSVWPVMYIGEYSNVTRTNNTLLIDDSNLLNTINTVDKLFGLGSNKPDTYNIIYAMFSDLGYNNEYNFKVLEQDKLEIEEALSNKILAEANSLIGKEIRKDNIPNILGNIKDRVSGYYYNNDYNYLPLLVESSIIGSDLYNEKPSDVRDTLSILSFMKIQEAYPRGEYLGNDTIDSNYVEFYKILENYIKYSNQIREFLNS